MFFMPFPSSMYKNMDIENQCDNNPFIFWSKYKDDLSLLAKIANAAVMISASLVENERNFSSAAQVVSRT